MKLYYCSQCNASTDIHKFVTRHQLCKGLLSVNALNAIILKCEERGLLTVRSGTGRKAVSESVIADVATAIADGS